MSNPLKRARWRAASAWSSAREGTARTATWVKEGVAGAPGKLRGAVSRDGDDSEPKAKPAPATGSGAAASADRSRWERIGGAAALERARGDRRVAIAWIGGALLFVAWIGWTVYVWSENGSAAGIGVLVSWPAVLAALALVAGAGYGAWMMLRMIVPDTAPAIAGGAPAAEAESAEAEPDEAAGAETDEDAEADEEGEDAEADAEVDEDAEADDEAEDDDEA